MSSQPTDRCHDQCQVEIMLSARAWIFNSTSRHLSSGGAIAALSGWQHMSQPGTSCQTLAKRPRPAKKNINLPPPRTYLVTILPTNTPPQLNRLNFACQKGEGKRNRQRGRKDYKRSTGIRKQRGMEKKERRERGRWRRKIKGNHRPRPPIPLSFSHTHTFSLSHSLAWVPLTLALQGLAILAISTTLGSISPASGRAKRHEKKSVATAICRQPRDRKSVV